ncbi:hypothetical protein [Streptomyces sp. NBC_00554]|uniref:hypothetical protein n=1 Tax=unclassified Streptomyces TaxID=2593676 RepID=UPI00352E5D08|nr:hypothetical protein OG256_14820 [Streptomyces sp. NBC_00564]WUC52379.1 hypothetical protein OG266_30140 [Streptomyces sp. NBC_00554]
MTERGLICCYCQKAITPAQQRRSYDKFSSSVGGSAFHYHLACLLKWAKSPTARS